MTNCTKGGVDIFKNEKNMGIWIFAEIFEIAKILQIYKGKIRRGNSVLSAPILLKLFLKAAELQSRKSQEIWAHGCYWKNMCNRERKKLWVFKTPQDS